MAPFSGCEDGPGGRALRGWFSGACLGLMLVLCFVVQVGVAKAALKDSSHDFTGRSFTTGSMCAGCHLAHNSPTGAKLIWSRDMSLEEAFFAQISDPNYIPSSTLYRYDCHIDNESALPSPDNDPSDFSIEPSNIAFGDNHTGSTCTPSSVVGYYETKEGMVPSSLVCPPPTDGSSTGGHFWKRVPRAPKERGDKIDCAMCHDPHNSVTSGNEVFLRATVSDGGIPITIGSNLDASINTRNGTGTGRDMCLACHKAGIVLYDVALPIPPTYVPQHDGGDSTPCTNTDCHPHNFPDKPTTLGCAACHGNATNLTYWPDGAAVPDRLGRHSVHISRLATKLGFGAGPTYTDANQKTMCAYCHENPAGTMFEGALHKNLVRNVTGYVDFLWTTIGADESTDTDATLVTAGSTCANFDCHNQQATPAVYGWYAAGTSACTMCHEVGGTGIAQPVDGLHDNTPLPTVSGVAHDESFPTGGTCTTCHVYLPAFSASSTHMVNGTTPADGGANTTADFYVFTAYTDSTAACSGATVNVNCHAGVGDAGTWARVWSTTGYNSDGTECANCHGGLTESDWTFGWGANSTVDGNVEHNYSWDGDATSAEVIGNHSDDIGQASRCNLCHVYQYAGYTTNGGGSIGWVTNGGNPSTYHGDGSIAMNSNSTVRYNSTSYGCDVQSCHDTGTAAVSHRLEKSRWNLNFLSGPQGACFGCHGSSVNQTWWPDGAATPDRVGEHDVHISRLAVQLGYGAGPTYDPANQRTMCAYCHPNPSGATFSGVHNNGTRNVTGYVDALWTTIGAIESTDTDATLVTATTTCANFDCHNRQSTPAAYGWYAGGATACTMCHAVGGTGISQPVDGLHDNTPLPTVSGVAHDELFPTGGTCTTCHVYLPAFSSGSSHMANGTTPADGGANTTADFYVFTAYTDSSAACSGAPVNANCHDGPGDAGTWVRLWSTTAYNSDGTECANCHGGINESDWTFGSGANSPADGNVEHNYGWDLDATSAEVIGNHNDDVGQGSRCNLCHVYQFGVYTTNGTDSHIGWLGNTANNSTYHGDGSIAMNSNSTVKYNSTSYGCDLQACHDTGTDASPHKLEDSRWSVNLLVGPQGACFGCHGNNVNGTYWPDGAATPDRLGEHDIHISRLAAELNYGAGPNYTDAQQKTMCAYCHPNPAGGAFGGVHNDGARNVTGYVDALWTTIGAAESTDVDATLVTGDMTCANVDCHNQQATLAAYGWYAGGASTCTMCHAVGGTGIADPTDGLHDDTSLPTISGVAHDESFPTGGTCTTCHVYMPAVSNTSTHMSNGTTPADGPANTTADFYVFTAYTDSTAGCSGTPVNAGCHDGAGDAGTWARVWSTTAYNSDGTECANCHGGINESDWTFGSGAHSTTDGNVEHNYNWDTDGGSAEVIGNHTGNTGEMDRCDLCHVYEFGVYTTNGTDSHIGWVGNTANNSTYHGNNSLEMNSNSTVKYNSTSYGCDLQACHDTGTDASPHKLEDGGWVINLIVGPEATCYTCHGNSTNASYWPDTADTVTTPDRLGEHDIHISRLATKLNYGAGPTYSDAQQKTMCAYCHPNPAGGTFGGVHNDGAWNVTGFVDPIWTTIGAAESTDADATYDHSAGSCANFDCHNNNVTPAGYTWYAGGASTCTMCHAVGGTGIADPTDGLHDDTPLPTVSGVAHDESFPTGGTCTTCHVYVPAFSSGSSHMANGTTPADGTANTTADFYVFTAYTDSTAGCSGASVNADCHDGAGDAGTWARVWSTTAYNSDGTECANCHGGINESDWTFGSGAHSTTDGNVEHNYNWDTDGGSAEVIGNHTGNTGEMDRCDLCHVYEFGLYTTNGTDSHIGWVGNTANNSTYHGNNSLEMNSNSTVRYNSTSYGCDLQGCHDNGTDASPHKLEDSRWNINPIVGPLATCSVCHGNSTNATYWPDGATSPDRSGRHGIHVSRVAARLGYGAGPTYSDGSQKNICAYCHPNPTGATFGAVHNNGSHDVTGYFDYLWTDIGAAEETDTDAVYTEASGTCENLDCHNRKATDASYSWSWYDTGTTACLMCHTVGGGTSYLADPTDGLHDNTASPTISGVSHDDSFPTGGSCATCHVYMPAVSNTSTHMTDGATPSDDTGNTTADFYVFTAYTDSTAGCSGAPVDADCHDGPGETGSWARRWDATAYNSDGTECANCHGGINESDWTFGSGAHSTSDGNVEHNYNWDGDFTASEVIGNHDANTGQGDRCNMCHVYQYTGYTTNGGGSIGWAGNAANTSSYHGNDSIEMNSHSTVRYNSATYGCDGGVCHNSCAGPHELEDSRWGVNLIANGPPGTCEGCHDGSVALAPNVMSYWDGSWWDSTQGGLDSTQQGGHGDPDGVAIRLCADCHDVSQPACSHVNGTLNSVELRQNLNGNTAHLRTFFFDTESEDYHVQINFDSGCFNGPPGGQCHAFLSGFGFKDMRHAKDSDPVANAVKFGTHITRSDGEAAGIPIDSDLTTRASTAEPDYAPCIACHNPHGTGNTNHKGAVATQSNKMIRREMGGGDWWRNSTPFCTVCHQ